ncbi:MAG: hypothetical protein ABIO43_08395, partial [Sphingomicrobium sp.]
MGVYTPNLFRYGLLATLLLLATAPAAAQEEIQTPAQSLAQDAVEFARDRAIPAEQAVQRLRALEESVGATDRLRAEFRDRLAGIAVDHEPIDRILVLLTGNEPVADRTLAGAGIDIPIQFRTGARATRDQIVAAMRRFQPTLRRELPSARGFGLDQRTGELVLFVTNADSDRFGLDAIRQRAEALTGVPVNVRMADGSAVNMALAGGARLVGRNDDGRNYACTSGFAVTDGARDGIATAAHCPDTLLYLDPDGTRRPLEYVGQWGWSYQDVQVNSVAERLRPLFYSDPKSGALRRVTSWRNRVSLRAGDYVCHYGESSGYSCAEVELTDYAPPGELCGGPCAPMWVTVKGPSCRSGDSGGPVFLGSTAIGIFKGGSGTRSPRCNFYYFMSIDFLPAGWSLLYKDPEAAIR